VFLLFFAAMAARILYIWGFIIRIIEVYVYIISQISIHTEHKKSLCI
jgi:hypothetical protein